MDPLLGALALDLPEPALQAFLSDQQDPSFALLHSATVTSFRSAKIEQNELKKFQDFLRQFGCVDLFGVYSATGPAGDVTSSTPFLSAMLHKLVQHGDNVITDMGAENELTKSRAAACLPTVSSYLSAYVPHPELQVLHVSVDAFKSLIEVFSLVEREVKAMKLSPTNPPSWLVDLTQRPWCPCVNDDLAADRIRRGLPVQYLVTSPLNILPHSHCHTGLAVHPDIKSAGLFIKAPVGRDFDHLSSLLSWMSRQDRVIASISIMTAMYKTLCSMTDVDAGALTVLRGLLSGGKKFLWIPDSKPRSPTSLEWGALVPLSSVVLLDVSNLLPSSGPVKVLYSHYEAEDMKLLLSRNLQGRSVERVCFVCQAIDGMFGSRGLQWPGSTRGNHLCECKDTGFGRYEWDSAIPITCAITD